MFKTELSTDVEIELSHSQYKQWVQDDWDWKSGWITSNSVYLSGIVDNKN